ncbi:MAG: ribonuclease H-like domain-containing protein [Bacteroidetes bacterium]|nr:ribonuclease H-like domain-containing protein [Bacteroidota bacterium]
MPESAHLNNILFLDIETVPQYSSYEELPEDFKELWHNKTYRYKDMSKEETDPELYKIWAGIPSEFAKVICISVGFFNGNTFRVKSFYGDDEKAILTEFKNLLDKKYTESAQALNSKRPYDAPKYYMCGHNGIEFDFPFLARRIMIHRMELPDMLNIAGTKSWNNKHLLDTMELWKFGDQKEKTSLKLLAACLGIPSPKDDISGKDVARVYYEEKDLERIKKYCEKDTLTVARIYQCFLQQEPVKDEDVMFL